MGIYLFLYDGFTFKQRRKRVRVCARVPLYLITQRVVLRPLVGFAGDMSPVKYIRVYSSETLLLCFVVISARLVQMRRTCSVQKMSR